MPVCEDCLRVGGFDPTDAAATRCPDCRDRQRLESRGKAMARRIAAERAGDKITWRELGVRDGWTCHLCRGAVDRVPGTAKAPMGATVDHLIPIADNGTHTWDNVALAHRTCNLARGTKGTAQLRLVG